LPRLFCADLVLKDSLPTLDQIDQVERTGRVWRGTLGGGGRTGEVRLREQWIHTERLSTVGQLVSGVAHELNNPLQSVLGFTELLSETEREPQAKRDLGQVRLEAIRAGRIVRNLLAFVRRSSSERSLASLNEIVRTTIST